jgi:hypothetical protein
LRQFRISRMSNCGLRRPVPVPQKDLHLVEAALVTDRIVISLDETARAELSVPAAAEVMWVHPVDKGGHVVYWLNKGAEPIDAWKLGQR